MRATQVRLAAGVLVAGLLAVFAGVTPGVPKGRDAAAGSGREPVAVGRTVLACPGGVGPGSLASSIDAGSWPVRLSASAAKQLTGSPAVARATVLRTDGDGTTVPGLSYDQRGSAAHAELAATNRAVVLTATGALAPGATASVRSRAADGAQQGMSEIACTKPGTRFWLTGLSESLGEHAAIVLVNVDDSPAQVELALDDERGAVDVPGAENIRVPAHAREVLDLDELAPGSTALAVGVHVTSGRVVAAAHQSATSGEAKLGNGWLPAGPEPARTVVLPGVVAGAAKVTLTVLAPGEDAGTATVRLLTPHGPIEPAGHNQVSLTPGKVATVDLTGLFAGAAAAVEVTADVPVVAGLRQQAEPAAAGPGDTDLALTAPATALRRPVAMSGPPAGATGTVLLTAPAHGASATVAVVGDGGRTVASTTVKVPAGSTVASKLPDSASGRTVLVTPTSGGKLVVSRAAAAVVDKVPQLSILQPAPPQMQAMRAQLTRALR